MSLEKKNKSSVTSTILQKAGEAIYDIDFGAPTSIRNGNKTGSIGIHGGYLRCKQKE